MQMMLMLMGCVKQKEGGKRRMRSDEDDQELPQVLFSYY